MHFAAIHGLGQPMENLAILDTNLQVFHFKQCGHQSLSFDHHRHPRLNALGFSLECSPFAASL
jgi:hypothetical protein